MDTKPVRTPMDRIHEAGMVFALGIMGSFLIAALVSGGAEVEQVKDEPRLVEMHVNHK